EIPSNEFSSKFLLERNLTHTVRPQGEIPSNEFSSKFLLERNLTHTVRPQGEIQGCISSNVSYSPHTSAQSASTTLPLAMGV
ncbi:MAG: hypothetical protein ACI8W7_001332, partial [Gammaproteobacteria bacterium]